LTQAPYPVLRAWTSDQNWKRIADAVEVRVVTIR